MKNNLFFNKSIENIYSKPSKEAEVVTQILYGEKFKVLKKKGDWIQIKQNYDHYIGYIKKANFRKKFNPEFKVKKLKTNIYEIKNKRFKKTKQSIFFGSQLSISKKTKKFYEFEPNKWIKKEDLAKLDHVEKNYNKILKLFLNTKYLWGGRSSNGIDCSALIQIIFFYNNKFFPRDTKDQVKYCRKKQSKKFHRGDIIFWKGHVGICVDKTNFLHAYGPRKKVLIMKTLNTIDLIKKTANLTVKKVSNISKY